MSAVRTLNDRLSRWYLWRNMLASNAPEAFGALGALAAVGFGLVQLVAPTIHRERLPGHVSAFPPESWGLAFLLVGLWLFIMSFTGRREDMEASALLVSLIWGLFGVLALIPDALAATPSSVVLVFFATAEAALVSLMAGGTDDDGH